ncbi:uncharacterized protein ASCRUDRAFT_118835 [Ascoidea rubescens DSM 1968]|uniref:Uncharacterized protein n=1 Tax=Ascoidea rubescens DSM 1968 TaxID=1344418 RepID=A0A1D2VAX8_9ASCO|nr:hypothetical protein ASCRUDRAFT_118835 [Ascoidea rubescens DSM 1968]ODV58750.1 hypothetical protein ASCRUDRAFT_118835 [Ascoidea rubescens DSM 1968]
MSDIDSFTRPIGTNESFWVAFNNCKLQRNLNLSLKLNEKLDSRYLIYRIIQDLVFENSYLALKVSQKSSDIIEDDLFFFKPFDTIKFDDVVKFIDNDNWTDINDDLLSYLDLNFQFHQAYLKSTPVWKVLVINSDIICFVCDHLLDGISTLNFFTQFLSRLNSYHDQILQGQFTLQDDSKIPQNIFEFNRDFKQLAKIPKSLDQIVNIEPPAGYKSSMTPPSNHQIFKFNNVLNNYEYKSYIKLLRLTSAQSRNLNSTLKSKKLKMASFIQVAFLIAISSYLIENTDENLQKNLLYDFAIPLNLRPYASDSKNWKPEISQPENVLYGCYVSLVQFVLKFNDYHNLKDSLWDFVSFIDKLRSQIINDQFLNSIYNIGWRKSNDIKTSFLEKILSSSIGKPRTHSVRLSNLGFYKMNTNPDSYYKIIDLVNSANISANSDTSLINTISTENGMNMSVHFLAGLLNTDPTEDKKEFDIIILKFYYIILNLNLDYD